jgi:dephospho-CoA kinase
MSISNNLPEIIGLGGTFASGKDTLARELVRNYGYTHASTSDMVRAAARERYGNIERPTLTKVGAELRAEGSLGVLAERALALNARPIVISGIRTVGEATAIKNAGGVMVFVDADPRIRYERMQGRARDAEARLTLDEFLDKEKNEINGINAGTINIGAVRNLADINLDNSGSKEQFMDAAMKSLEQHQTNPS